MLNCSEIYILQEHELLIIPALKGVEHVLGAASRCSTLKKVVMTSSLAAVMGDNAERGPGHVFTEADWTLVCSLQAGML